MADRSHHPSCVDLVFPVVGPSVPRDHGYALYAAVSRVVPSAHKDRDIGIFPIRGTSAGDGTLRLTDRSSLRVRVPALKLPELLPLAGKLVDLDGIRLRLGVPQVRPLVPAAALSSALVLIKLARQPGHDGPPQVTPEAFLAAARKQLSKLGIEQAEAAVQIVKGGPHAGEARRRVIRVREQVHAGYSMVVQRLTADESIRLQEAGLGGRRLMGCGLFLPTRLTQGES